MITRFEEVKLKQIAKDANGKTKQRTFIHTINPFNTNKDGVMKNRKEVFQDLLLEAEKWKEEIKKSKQ